MKNSVRLPGSEHFEDDCWCGPAEVQQCPDCTPNTAKSCERCKGEGYVPVYDPDATYLIVHRTIEEIINRAGIGKEQVPE